MLNYKHLYYFWTTAREGGVTLAGKRLNLSPQTISGQISALENHFGKPLFVRKGRALALTDVGKVVLNYADEIFSAGSDLEEAIKHLPKEPTQNFKVGIAEVIPKHVSYDILKPALELPNPVRLTCREGHLEDLLGDLTIHRLDLVITERKIPEWISTRAKTHKIGECGMSFFATRKLRKQMKGDFPSCLDGVAFLMPSNITIIHNRLLSWFDEQNISPRIVGEFDDSALMKTFGAEGAGVFVGPTPLAHQYKTNYGVEEIGKTKEIKEEYYIVSVGRKNLFPILSKITRKKIDWTLHD